MQDPTLLEEWGRRLNWGIRLRNGRGEVYEKLSSGENRDLEFYLLPTSLEIARQQIGKVAAALGLQEVKEGVWEKVVPKVV